MRTQWFEVKRAHSPVRWRFLVVGGRIAAATEPNWHDHEIIGRSWSDVEAGFLKAGDKIEELPEL